MIDYLSEIPLSGRMLAPEPARTDAGSSKRAALGFVAGVENRLVASAVNRLMHSVTSGEQPCSHRIIPKLLALFGPSGTGKTHLARGLVRHWNDERGLESAVYLTAGDFYRQFIEAIKRNEAFEFRRAIRDHEMLAIDDLHQLPSHDYVSQELRSTLDSYEDSGRTVIVTSARPANTLANISPDVRSRLASGLMLQLAPPGNAARMKIVCRTAESLGRPLSDEAASHLADGVSGTANDLFGAVFELCTAAAGHPNGDAAHAVQILTARHARRPNLREIVAAVARYFGLPQTQLKSHSRRQSIVSARAVAVYLARELTGASYEQIGRALGGRDHTTIIHNYRKIERIRSRDPIIQEAIEKLNRILLNRWEHIC